MDKNNSKIVLIAVVVAIAAAWVINDKGMMTSDNSIPEGKLDTSVEPLKYSLDFNIDPRLDRFSGHTEIDVQFNQAQSHIWLHGFNLTVSSAVFTSTDGTQYQGSYEQVGDETGVAKVSFTSDIPVGTGTLVMDYDAPFNPSLEGIYKVVEEGEAYAFTQYEATSARFAFPGFDEPRFKTIFDVTVTYPTDQKVITNTPLLSEEDLGNGSTKAVFATTQPLPTYLLALAVGPLDIVEWEAIPATELRSNPIPLRAASAKGKGGRLEYALKETALMLTTLEEYFDAPYPYAKLDLIAVPDFSAGAMENAGAITYREQRLLLDENSSIGLKRAFISTHTHELAHMWFGDLVTPKWWDDIWLNESFASWMAAKALTIAHPDENYGGTNIDRTHYIMGADSRVNVRQVRQPIESHHDIATAFDLITYLKGGSILNTFEYYMGEDAFRDGIRLHMERFPHSVADVYDFMSSLEDGSGQKGIASSFTSFIEQPGIPFITVTGVETGDNGTSLTVSQSRYLPVGSKGSTDSTWEAPLCFSFGVEGGFERRCRMVSEAQETLTFDDVNNITYVHPNSDGSGYYRWSLEDDQWDAILAAYDGLSDNEKKSLYDAATSSYSAGGTSVEKLVSIMDVVANDPKWEVAQRPLGTLRGFEGSIESEESKEVLLAHAREIYGPVLTNLGLWPYTAADEANPTETALKRSGAVNFLATTAKHKALRADLLAMTKAYIGFEGDGEIHEEAINADFIANGLVIGVEEIDGAFTEALLTHLASSSDAVLRQRILGAVVNTKDEAITERLFTMISDPNLRDNEAIQVLWNGLRTNEDKRDLVWSWVQVNKDVVVDRIPTWRKGNIANTVGGWCDASRIDEYKAFFEPFIDGLEGGPRQFAQVIETTELCSALRELRTPELEAYFSTN